MVVKVGVVGSGMMARGIAACVAAGGPHEVWIYGRRHEAAEEAAEKARDLMAFMQEHGVASPQCGRVFATSSLQEAVSGADFVFESIVEDLPQKQAMFAQLESITTSSTILCTNTSSLSVTAIASGCSDAGAKRVIAAHFIGPAHLVPLVELCPAEQTAGEGPIERARSFLTAIGKRPVVLKKEIEGFIAARLQAALYRECLHLYKSGVADCDAVDSAVFNGFGRRLNQIGPFLQADFAGVDLVQGTHARFFPQLGAYQRDERADELVSQGALGVKALRGHYEWTEEKAREIAGRRDAELLRRLKQDRAGSSKL
jgi:3-hydroxybutyryl-CoA dehydrogenase